MHAGLVDFHCHLDLYPDFEAEVRRCDQDGVITLAVTTTPKAWPRNHELASLTENVHAALGLHPQLVADRAYEISLWEELLPRTRFIGEVGLDAGQKFFKSFDTQKLIFARILSACEAVRNRIITVHSFRSTKVVLDMIEQYLPPTHGRIVLHWFTGTAAEARRAIDLGCYFSINKEMLVSNRHEGTIRSIPMNRILTETDGPFTKFGTRPSVPRDVRESLEGLARLHSMPTQNISSMIMRNLQELLTEQA